MKVFTAQQMRDFDRAAIEEYGIPSIVLMENAALRVVEFLEAKFAPLGEKKIVILCGKGNNGGDGLAIARHLKNAGAAVGIYLVAPKEEYSGDALINLHPLTIRHRASYNRGLIEFDAENITSQSEMEERLRSCDLILDALCGTGFSGEIRLKSLHSLLSATLYTNTIAIDLPSSLNADSGEKKKRTPHCSHTITFVAPKRGMFVRSGLELCGEVWIGEVGNSLHQMEETEADVETLDLEFIQRDFYHFFSGRPIDAHKGDAGRALLIGGSFGMSGALALASRAALNAGCGLCIAAMPERVLPIFAVSILEATSHPLPCDESGKLLERAADELPALWRGVQVVALGPGLSRSEEAQKFVARVVRECPLPLIIDADALHALPAIAAEVKAREADTILTPHPGEMGVLMGISAGEVNDSRFETVAVCAEKYGATVVLKGARSLVATPDGQIFVNLTGNAGMATGGSGDVLTGTIAGLLAQLKNSADATKLGVYLHGFAGDLAFEEKGNGLVAGDIAANLGRALVEIPRREVERINGRLRRLM